MKIRVALVSGGTRGIGKAITERLLKDGWHVVVCARHAPSTLPYYGKAQARFFPCDVRDPVAIEALTNEVTNEYGQLDLVVNNAGGSPAALLADSSASLLEKVIALNLVAPLLIARATYPALQASKGSLINIASISGLRAAPGTVAYGAAKAGLISATKGLALEWGPDVRVNAIVVGLVENADQADHYGGPEGIARIANMLPLKRMARGTDIADCVAWLTSQDAAYISGAAIEMHGGGEIPAFVALARNER